NNGVSNSEPLVETMEKAFASAQKILDISFPTNPLDIIVTADAISLPGKPSLRDIRLAASSDANQFTLQSLQAKLPANTQINLSAKAPLNAEKKPTQLIATLNASSDNPAQAFSANASASAGKSDPISLNTTATLSRQSLKLEPLQVTQQGQTLNGTVLYQPKAAVPLQLALRGGALNLDSFKSAEKANEKGEIQQKSAAANNDSILNRLKGFKAQFDVAIDRVITGGKNLRNVTAKGLFSDSGLNLQQASANLEGLALGANGTIGKLSPLGDLNLTVNGQTDNLSNTMQALGNKEARNLGATNFGGTIKGDMSKIALNIDAKLDQGTGKIKGDVLGLDTGKTGFDGTINLNHPETATIVRNFGNMSPASALGPFALNATVTYAGETIKADNVELKLGSAGGLSGNVDITPNGQQKNINANIKSDKLDLAALMGEKSAAASGTTSAPASSADEGWSRDPVNLDVIRNLNGKATVKIAELYYKDFIIKNFNNDIAFANGVMKLNDLSADLFDAGRIVVDGTLAPSPQGQPHKGQFNLTIKDTDAVKFFNALDSKLFAKGSFSAQQQLSFSGASPYQIINSLSGDGQFKLRDAVANGLDLDALAAKMDRPNSVSDFTGILQQAKAGGTTDIGNVDVPISIRNGVANIAQTAVKTKLTETNFGGTADLPSKTVNMGGQIRFTEQKNMPPLGLKITGPFSAPRKEFDSQSVASFLIQKSTAKYQDKAIEKVDKLLGDKVPGGLGGLLGLPSSKNTTTTPATTTETPAPTTAPAATETTAPVTTNEAAPTAPTPPTAPEAPSATPEPAPLSKKEQQKQDLQNAAGQLLQGLMGGQQQQ
ncbi:MAG TPA: AsmA-like C-terminal region-containing protein, partial [Alphaproteobacteria bacterium]